MTFLHDDLREVGATIADGSVDLILTDPPYGEAFLPLRPALADFAARVLTPDGFLITLSGHMFLPTVMEALSARLRYVWVGVLYHRGPNVFIRAQQCYTTFKPVLIYAKGHACPPVVWQDGAETVRSKDYHGWGQDPEVLKHIVKGFIQPGALVVDPMLGGGTSALVASDLGARVIGIDIAEDVLFSLTFRWLRALVWTLL